MVYRKTQFKKSTGATANTNSRFRKRWYFNAGANLPFVGRTNLSFGTTKAKRSLSSYIKKVELSESEPKHKILQEEGLTAVATNTVFTQNLIGNLGTGNTSTTRIGDKIHLARIHIKARFTSTTSSAPAMFRVMFIKHDAEYRGTVDSFGSGLGSSELFQAFPNSIAAIKDPKLVHVLAEDVVILPAQQQANQLRTVFKDYVLDINKPVTYKMSSAYMSKGNYYAVVLPYITGGTTGVTAVGDFAFTTDIIFKDL